MLKLFVVACLVPLIPLGANAQTCGDIDNCHSCYSALACKWCGQYVNATLASEPLYQGYTVGGCIEVEEECSTVQFGTLNGLLNFNMPLMRTSSKSFVEEFELSGKPHTSQGLSQAGCTSFKFPSSIKVKTCDDCLARGTDYGFCQVDVGVGSAKITNGGVCLHKSIGALCDSSIVPYKGPSLLLAMANINLYYATESMHCDEDKGGFEFVKPNKKLDKKCEHNNSCFTCARSVGVCTWCSGEVQAKLFNKEIKGDFFGKCIAGANKDCSHHVHFGSLPSVLNKMGGSLKSVELKKESRERCSTLEWPPAFAEPDCQHCVTDASRKWCHIDAVKPNDAGGSVSGGICLDVANDFLCTIQFVGDDKLGRITSALRNTTASCNSIKTATKTPDPKPATTSQSPKPSTAMQTEEQSTTSGSGQVRLTASLIVATLMGTAVLL